MELLEYTLLIYKGAGTDQIDVTLGVLFSDIKGEFKCFRYSDIYKIHLDKEDCVGIEMLDKLLESIEEEVRKSEDFDLRKFTKYWINDFCFKDIRSIKTSNFEIAADEICHYTIGTEPNYIYI